MIELTTTSAVVLGILVAALAIIAISATHRLDKQQTEHAQREDAEDGALDMLGMLVITLTFDQLDHSIDVPKWVALDWYIHGRSAQVEKTDEGYRVSVT